MYNLNCMQHPIWSWYANNLLCLQQGEALRVYKTEASRKANEVHGLIRSGSAALPDVCWDCHHCAGSVKYCYALTLACYLSQVLDVEYL